MSHRYGGVQRMVVLCAHAMRCAPPYNVLHFPLAPLRAQHVHYQYAPLLDIGISYAATNGGLYIYVREGHK